MVGRSSHLKLLILFGSFVIKSAAQPCNGGPCGENAVYCYDDTMEKWECKCIRGFKSISSSTINCADIDECSAVDMHNCGNHTRCRNAVGYYTCECAPGFGTLKAKGGRWECSDFNECSAWQRNNCGTGSECINTWGGYTCRCLTGFATPTVSHGETTCTDLDECRANTFTCGRGSVCENLPGSYRCSCGPGYRRGGALSDVNSCKDIDECAENSDNCGKHSRCINTPGSFRCVCRDGFRSPDDNGTDCAHTGTEIAREVAETPLGSTQTTLASTEDKEEKRSGDLYIGVGVGIGAAFVIIAIFFMVAYIAGSKRKSGKQSIQHDLHKYQSDPRRHFVDVDSPVYEDIGPPLTSMTRAAERPPVHIPPFKSATVGRQPAVRSISESVDTKSLHNWRLIHNEINEALYAASSVDRSPIYCNTIEREKRNRPSLEPMVEELYYSPVYHSCEDIPAVTKKPVKPPVAPKLRRLAHTMNSPKRHMIQRNRQRVWVSRVHSEPDAGGTGPDKAPQLTPGHPAFRRLASEGDILDVKKKQSDHDLMEGTILRCGKKYYILEPQENDSSTGKPTLFTIKTDADEAL